MAMKMHDEVHTNLGSHNKEEFFSLILSAKAGLALDLADRISTPFLFACSSAL